MDLNLNKVSGYFYWLWGQYHKHIVNNFPKYPFKIVGKEYSSKEEAEILVIKIENTKKIFKKSPKELVANDSILCGFSQHDVRLITAMACQFVNSPKYQIIEQRKIKNQNLFLIKEKGVKGMLLRSANEISSDKQMVSQFCAKDAHLIGYVTGSHQQYTIEGIDRREK